MAYQAPKGTRDVTPAESYRWQYVEALIRDLNAMIVRMATLADGGRITAQGTHGELLQTSQIYREIYEQQTKGGAGDE